MTLYETLTLGSAILAVVVAVVSLIRTRILNERQLELQETTSRLAAKQLELIREHESARIRVRLQKRGDYLKFVIENHGGAVARDIHFCILDSNVARNPLIGDEYAEKIPITALHPGDEVTLFADDSFGSSARYKVEVRWKNPDGKQARDEIVVGL